MSPRVNDRGLDTLAMRDVLVTLDGGSGYARVSASVTDDEARAAMVAAVESGRLPWHTGARLPWVVSDGYGVRVLVPLRVP